MKEFKFRVWNKVQNFFYSPERIAITSSGGVLIYECWGDDKSPSWQIDGYNGNKIYEIQPATGIKDKNGKEIYDGDIVRIRGFEDWFDKVGYYYNVLIKYSGNPALFRISKMAYINNGQVLNDYLSIRGHSIEIIGNILQNPDMIDGERVRQLSN